MTLKKDHLVELKKEGYQTKTVVIANSLGAGWVAADLLLGIPAALVGLVGSVSDADEGRHGEMGLTMMIFFGAAVAPVTVDAITGAWNSFDQREINTSLEKIK
ncbi:MAG: hypothetical protein FVQ81_16095 [Candidatus Glassbacteria bacterium]|nr:hypothetical protein [Candidatus Glassbacteria bacterium]